MVNKKLMEFCEDIKIPQIFKIQEGLGKELETLYGLGVKCYEIEFLIELKIKEEIITEI